MSVYHSQKSHDTLSLQGILPTNFRTDWCKDFFKGKCSRGKFCSRAHSIEQLQIDAAIEAGKLDQRFKMQFCGDANSGELSLVLLHTVILLLPAVCGDISIDSF